MNVLIIGAYGLIGSGIAAHLRAQMHTITGLGRDIETGARVLPGLRWMQADVSRLTKVEDWHPYLRSIDVVVNCSGALQDGPSDSLEALHNHAVAALAKACAQLDVHLIQISAVGASPTAPSAFLASKGRGDAAIRTSGALFHIFRPGLVLARHSYGGSALLRMLAAVPVVQPIALAEAQVQTVALDDVARAVSAALAGAIPNGAEIDLVEPDPQFLHSVIAEMRHWLGFAPARRLIHVPLPVTRFIGLCADGLGHLGWRSPLRTTALRVLSDGVLGTPSDMAKFGVPNVAPLPVTLATMPARGEDRLHARMSLLMPIIIVTLVVFWAASGLIGILRAPTAALVLQNVGWPQWMAVASVVFWGIIDIVIAGAFAWRRTAKHACWAAIAVSLFYLAASSVFVPGLWFDPLGPLVKVIPSITLALVARIALETR